MDRSDNKVSANESEVDVIDTSFTELIYNLNGWGGGKGEI